MTTTTPPAQATAPTRRRFTVEEFYAMVDAGILAEDERVELLNGEVFAMATIGTLSKPSNRPNQLTAQHKSNSSTLSYRYLIGMKNGTAWITVAAGPAKGFTLGLIDK